MPQVIVIDEIGTELEAQAARTIAERGVQLIGTAHGNNLDNLMLNPTLSDLIGGIQSVTLGDEEARRRRSQKSVLERKAPPTFDVIVEIQDRERVTRPRRRGGHRGRDAARRPGRAGAPLARRGGRPSLPGAAASRRRARQSGGDRFSGLTGSGAGAWRTRAGLARRRHLPHRRLRGRGPAARPAGVPAGPVGGWRSGARRPGSRIVRPRSGPRSRRATDRPAERPARRAVRGRRPDGRPAPRRHAVRRRRHRRSRAAGARGGATPAVAGGPRPRRARARSARRHGARRRRRALDALREDEGTRPGQRRRARGRRGGADRPDGARGDRAAIDGASEDDEDDGARRRGPPIGAARCRRCGCSRTGSAASASSRRSATCSCR